MRSGAALQIGNLTGEYWSAMVVMTVYGRRVCKAWRNMKRRTNNTTDLLGAQQE